MDSFRRQMYIDTPEKSAKRSLIGGKGEEEESELDLGQSRRERFETTDQSRSMFVNGVYIQQHALDSIKEKDGQKIPYSKKEILCQPACDLETLEQYAQFKENIDGNEQKLLTQFLKDAKEKNLEPQKISSVKNVVEFDPQTKKKKYSVSVTFTDKDNDKVHYKFQKAEGEEGKTKVYNLPPEDEWDRNRRMLDL